MKWLLHKLWDDHTKRPNLRVVLVNGDEHTFFADDSASWNFDDSYDILVQWEAGVLTKAVAISAIVSVVPDYGD